MARRSPETIRLIAKGPDLMVAQRKQNLVKNSNEIINFTNVNKNTIDSLKVFPKTRLGF